MVEYNPTPLHNWIKETTDKNYPKDDPSIHVVGQFGDNFVLLSWFSGAQLLVETDQCQTITYIGVAEIGLSDVKVVVQLPGIIKIAYASLSQDQELITFITEEFDNVTNSKTWQGQACECRPQQAPGSWLAVTDAHPVAVRGHFLLEGSSAPHQKTLLVLIHRHSIQLHQVQAVRDQPVRVVGGSVLCLEFVWCQWLPSRQCLAFLHPRGSLPKSSLHDWKDQEDPKEDLLSCVQFYSQGRCDTAFSIPLSTFGHCETINSNCSSNEDVDLNKITPSDLNLEVILWNEGNVCICYQPFNSFTGEQKEDQVENGNVLYWVSLLHQNVRLCALRTKDWETSRWPLSFAMLRDHQLLVMSSGSPAHILDTDPSHRPGFQIFLPESSWPMQLGSKVSVLSMPRQGGSALLCCRPAACVSLSLSGEELVSLFCATQLPGNRIHILHYLTTHHSHTESAPCLAKVFGAVAHDTWSRETRDLLSEYLLGSTFARVKKSGVSCHPILQHLPLSQMKTKECHWLRCEQLGPGLHLDWLLKQQTTTTTKSAGTGAQQTLESESRDMWHWLWHHQVAVQRRRLTDPDGTGFKMAALARLLEGILKKDFPIEVLSTESSSPPRTPIGFADLCSLCMRGNKPSGLSLPPDLSLTSSDDCLPFPTVKEDLVQREKSCSLIWSRLHQYLQQCCPLSSSSIINKICSDYILAQLHQSNTLCSLIFSIFGVAGNTQKPNYNFLRSLDVRRLQRLHGLLERFCVSCSSWGFPLPPGFNAVLTLTAFHTMHFMVFMQHVQLDAIKLQFQSVIHLVHSLDDGPDNLKRKLHLISYLSKEDGERLLRQWSHPIGDKYRARRRAREHLTNKGSGPEVQQISEHDTEQADGAVAMEAEFAIDAIQSG